MELVLALPVLVAVALLVLAGGRLLSASVALTDAARAGAVAAASAVARGQSSSQAAADAVAAAAAEGLSLTCSGDGVPASCVAVSAQTGDDSGEQMEVVTVYDQVDTGFPGLAPIQVRQRAAATP